MKCPNDFMKSKTHTKRKGSWTVGIPASWPLFKHMSENHGLTLLESEMDDIIQVVKKLPASANSMPKDGAMPRRQTEK